MSLYRLCMYVASSAPSERLFSLAGWQINKLRSNLSPESIEAILFLSENEKFFSNLDEIDTQ